jgi:methyl-accepting chemotaxis protein
MRINSIRTKILLITGSVFLLIGVLLMTISFFSAKSSSRQLVTEALNQKIEGDIHSFRNYVKLSFGTLSYQSGTLVDADGDPINDRNEMVDTIRKELGVIATIFVKDGDDFRRITTNVVKPDGQRAVNTLLGKASAAYQPVRQGNLYIGEANILGVPYMTAYDPLVDEEGSIIGIYFIGIQKKDLDTFLSKELSKLVFRLISAFVIIAIVGFSLLYIAVKILTNPIIQATNMLKDIAEGHGDLTKKLAVRSKDEIGELCTWFNQFVDKIKGIIINIKEGVETLSLSSEGLSSSSTTISDNTRDIADEANEVTETIQQSTENLNSISSGAEEMSSSMNVVASAVEEMSASIAEVTRNCEKASAIASEANREATNTNQIIEELNDAGHSIGRIVDLIQSIAAQTNLLALNATIEAASAGEAGKGFAVVANEVKVLAKQTSDASDDIRNQVGNMQQKAELAVTANRKISGTIEDINTTSQTILMTVREQNDAVSDIAQSTNNANIGAQDVARNVAESANSISRVSETVVKMNQGIASTSQEIDGIRTSCEQLNNLALQLGTVIRQFKIE